MQIVVNQNSFMACVFPESLGLEISKLILSFCCTQNDRFLFPSHLKSSLILKLFQVKGLKDGKHSTLFHLICTGYHNVLVC